MLATLRSVEKIHPITLKLWLFLHTVNTKAWFLMDVSLPLSWEKLSQALIGAPFLTFLPFSRLSCYHYGVYTGYTDLSAHFRLLLNSLCAVFFFF